MFLKLCIRGSSLTFTGPVVCHQVVPRPARAVEAEIQIIADMGAAAVVDQTLVDICGYADTQSFQTLFRTTVFLIADDELAY